MDTLNQLRRLTEQRNKRTFVLPPDEIHPAVSKGMPPAPPTRPVQPLPTENERMGTRLQDLVPGELVATEVGACYIRTTVYPVDHSHGPLPLGALLEQSPAALASMLPSARLEHTDSFLSSAVIDTETTGLGGGAGTYAFMVGVGTFEEWAHADATPGLHFVVRQLFLRSPADEPALLTVLHQLLHGRTLLLSFNGRSFDVPLLRARYLLNRTFLPESARLPALFGAETPHLDLLMPARQLWRRRLQSCRLTNLEAQLLGLTRSEEDVPGALIPEMYMQFQRTGHAGDMRRVFYHNAEDVVSTAAIAAQVGHVMLNAREPDQLDGRDWLSLGASYEKMQRWEEAVSAYRIALDRIDQVGAQAETFKRLSALCKRTRRWEDAVAIWEQWLSTIPSGDATPYIELAKYYEWQANDSEQAELWTSFGLHTVRSLLPRQRLPGQLADLERRLERLARKRRSAPKVGDARTGGAG